MAESLVKKSRVRDATQDMRAQIAAKLHGKFPELTANHISSIGTGLVVGASVLAAARAGKSSFPERMIYVGLYTLGSISDAFDGEMARLRGDSVNGAEFDYTNDRFQELVVYIGQAVVACRAGDLAGGIASITTAVTSPEPSIRRAMCEEVGVKGPEDGKDMLGFFGTRHGRPILGGFPIGIPQLAAPINALTTVANLKAAYDRSEDLQKPSTLEPTPEQIETAQFKQKAGRLIQFASVVGSAVVATSFWRTD